MTKSLGASRRSVARMIGTYDAAHLAILHSLPNPLALLDGSGKIVFVNRAWSTFSENHGLLNRDCSPGVSYLEVCERAQTELDFDGVRDLILALRRMLEGKQNHYSFEYTFCVEQLARWSRLRLTPFEENLGVVVGYEDITEHKLAEQKILRINRLYSVLRDIRETILCEHDAQTLFAETCRIMVQTGQLRMALVAERTFDSSPKLRVSTSYGATGNYIEGLIVTSDSGPRSRGTIGTAIREGSHNVCNDFLGDPRMEPWHEAAREHGYGSTASFPLRDFEGHPFGTLTLFAAEAHYFEEDEIRLMIAVADDLSFAVENRRREEGKRRIEAQLNFSQRELLQRGSLLAQAQRIGRMGSWTYLPASKELFWSDSTCEIFGIAPEEFRGTPEHFRSFILEEDRATYDASFGPDADGMLELEYRIRRPDGQVCWMYERGSIEYDSQGQVSRRLGMVMDVTQRKTAELALRESEERYRVTASQLASVLDSSLDVICSFDVEGRFLNVNLACEAVWGYTPSQLLGTRYMDHVLEEDRDATAREAQAIMSGRLARSFENRYRKRDGSIVHMQWTARWSEHEQIMFCVARDVTESKQYAQKLAEQASLLDKARDAIIVSGLDDKILYWNQSAERLYGWDASAVLGRSLKELLHSDPTFFEAATKSVLARGEWVGELEQLTKSGKSLVVEGHWTLVRDESGGAKSVLTINTDISQRRALEEQFYRAQRLDSIGTLAGGVAHDLNNVLTPILMAAEILRMEEVDPTRLGVIDMVADSAKRGADLLKQVLTFARGDEGPRVEVQVAQVLGETLKIAADTFPKQIRLESMLEPDLWRLQADPTQLHQVFLNLLLNARDAVGMRGTITVQAQNVLFDEHLAGNFLGARPGPYLRFDFKDAGAGIAQEVMDKIFDPFFTTKETGQGTGLGLSTTLSIVKGHGGFLQVESELEVGTNFAVYLPAHVAVAENSPPSGEEDGACSRGRGQTILVVDDEIAIRTITKSILERHGYHVLLAADGQEAMVVFEEHRGEIELLLTDMMMPAMDGPETVAALRARKPHLKVIAASGFSTSAMDARALEVDIKHFLVKPFSAQSLLQMISKVLQSAE